MIIDHVSGLGPDNIPLILTFAEASMQPLEFNNLEINKRERGVVICNPSRCKMDEQNCEVLRGMKPGPKPLKIGTSSSQLAIFENPFRRSLRASQHSPQHPPTPNSLPPSIIYLLLYSQTQRQRDKRQSTTHCTHYRTHI